MDELLLRLRRTCQYYTGLPWDAPPKGVVQDFTSEREFVELLHEGDPVVVAFTISCNHTKHLDRMLEAAAAQWHPRVRFVRVECPKHIGFCIARQRKDYPFIEIFHNSREKQVQTEQQGEGTITRYSVTVLPYTYDVSPYGFREFFKKYGVGGVSDAAAPEAGQQLPG